MKWLISMLLLLGCVLVVTSSLIHDYQQGKAATWDESWRQVMAFTRYIPEASISPEKPLQTSLLIPDDQHWRRVVARLKDPHFLIARSKLGGDQLNPIPLAPLDPFNLKLRTNGSPILPEKKLAYVEVAGLPNRVPLWAMETPVSLGDRIDVELSVPSGSTAQWGTIIMKAEFPLSKERNPHGDHLLTATIIGIVKWIGVGCVALSLFIVLLSRVYKRQR